MTGTSAPLRAMAAVGARLAILAALLVAATSVVAQAPAPGTVTQRNREIMVAAFDRWKAGEGSIFDLLSRDATVTLPGSGPSAGVWPRDQFLKKVARPFLAKLATPVAISVQGIYADGDTVVVHFIGSAFQRNGRPYHNDYAWIFRLSNEKVSSLTAFLDLRRFDDVNAHNDLGPAFDEKRGEY